MPAISAAGAIRQVRELVAVVGVVPIDSVAESTIHFRIEAGEGIVQHSANSDPQGNVHHVVEETAAVRKPGDVPADKPQSAGHFDWRGRDSSI